MKLRFALVPFVLFLLIITPACGRPAAPAGSSPTSQPSAPPTDTPTLQPTVQPSPTPTPSAPCDNILFPLVKGSQWIYQLSSADGSQPARLGLTVEDVADSRATISALDMSTGIITKTIAECEQGAIRNFPALSQMMFIGNAAASDFKLKYVAGVFAPAQSVFTENNWLVEWTSDFIASGVINIQDEEGPMQVLLQDSPIHIDWKTAGSGDAAFESVTVPAGTFERALKVQRQVQGDVSIVVEGSSAVGRLTLHTTQWYQPSTGLLRSRIDSGDLLYKGLTFPLDLQNTVELVKFEPAQ